MPAKAGIQFFCGKRQELDPSLRWDDKRVEPGVQRSPAPQRIAHASRAQCCYNALAR